MVLWRRFYIIQMILQLEIGVYTTSYSSFHLWDTDYGNPSYPVVNMFLQYRPVFTTYSRGPAASEILLQTLDLQHSNQNMRVPHPRKEQQHGLVVTVNNLESQFCLCWLKKQQVKLYPHLHAVCVLVCTAKLHSPFEQTIGSLISHIYAHTTDCNDDLTPHLIKMHKSYIIQKAMFHRML